MRQAVGLAAVGLAALVLAVPASATTLEATGHAERKGCDHMHPSSEAYNQIRALIRNHRPVVRVRRVAHWATCVATRAKSKEAWRRAAAHRAWRKRYNNVWPIRRNALSSSTLGRLSVLRGCETRGIPFPWNYRWNGHHDGAYQYDGRTWREAQGYYAWALGKHVTGWTSYAYDASPAHQDVITGYFFPTHTGRWQCHA